MVFDNEKYRTPILNKGIELISQSISVLEGFKNKNERQSFDYLPLCTLDEQEIQKVKVDLESLFSLKSLLISKGLYNKKCTVTT